MSSHVSAPDDDSVENEENELEEESELEIEIDKPEVVETTEIEFAAKKKSKSKSKSGLAKRDVGLTRADPLAAYMKDVQRYRLLTRDEERELAIRYTEEGDLDAARHLVTSNLRLVVKIAYDYRQAYKNLLDLVQEGNIGLMQAVKKYDPYKGVKLSSYAAWWIRAYMLRYILNNHRLVKLGTTQAQRKLFFNLQKEKSKLAAMGIDPTHEAIAERLSVPVRDVVSMDMRLSSGEASLNAPVGSPDGGRTTTRMELLPSSGQSIEDLLAEDEVGDILKKQIRIYGAGLEGKEKVIFEQRLMAEDPKTLQQLGDIFGVSRERVRQVEKRLLQRMKAYLRSEAGDVVDVYEA